MDASELSALSAESLIAGALAAAPDDFERWEFVVALHLRTDERTLELLFALAQSPQVPERIVAFDALGQFGTTLEPGPDSERPFATQIAERLIAASPVERDPAVIDSLATALGHLRDDRAVPTLAGWSSHPDDDVRLAVTFALGKFTTDLATETLLVLMTDLSDDVRDWSTFGLGVLNDVDGPRIRDALLARLNDTHDQVRVEALAGLARRGEIRALPRLRDEVRRLGHPDRVDDWAPVTDAAIEMATKTRDPVLCEVVRTERDSWLRESPQDPLPDDLLAAIAACQLDAGDPG